MDRQLIIYFSTMNLVSSKLVRSSKAVNNRSLETVQAYSCQLYIDSFRVSNRGFVYFVWYTNTTQISSLRYESTGKTVPVKETLTISVRVTSKNGKEQPLNTYLKLMSQSGEELDEHQLVVNGLPSHFKDMEVPMDRGICVIKMRRKLMNLGDQLQVSHQRSLFRTRNNQFTDKQSILSGDYQSVQEQLNRIKKELEDEVYLNNKLRNDRDVLLATKQDLEMEIQSILVQTSKELKMLREHYDTRISIREHSYEEEIENLVNMFNADATHSKKVLEMLMKQKIKFQDDLRVVEEKLQQHESLALQRNNRIDTLEREASQYKLTINQLELNIQEKQNQAQTMVREGQAQKASFTSQLQALQAQIEQYRRKVHDQDSMLIELRSRCQTLEDEVKNRASENAAAEEALKSLREKEEGLARENQLIAKEAQLLQQDKQGLIEQMEILKSKLQECQFEMDFNENVMGQLKRQQMQKEEELYQQLENLEKIYEKKIEDLIASYQTEKDNSQVTQKEKVELQSRIKDLQEMADGSEVKIQQLTKEVVHLQNEIQSNNSLVDAKEHTISELQATIRQLKEELEITKIQSPLERVKSQKSLKSNPAEAKPSVSNSTIESLNQLVKKLEEQNKQLLKDIENLRKTEELKDNEILQMKGELEKLHQPELQKSESKRVRSHRSSEKGVEFSQFREEDIQGMIDRKQEEINELKRKIDELQNLYIYLQQRLDKIIEMYPNVDMSKIDAEIPVIERCDSEEEEEIVLNKTASIHNQSIQTPKDFKKGSIAGDIASFQHEVREKQPKNNYYLPRSETRIQDPNIITLIKQTSAQDPISGHPPIGKIHNSAKRHPYLKKVSAAGSIREDTSEKSGNSWIKVSHSKKIKELQNTIYQLQQKQKIYLRQMQDSKNKIAALQSQLAKPNRIQPQGQQRQLSPTFRLPQIQKVNTESQVLLEDERMKNLIEDCKDKQSQITKRQARISQLQDQLRLNNSSKLELSNKIIVLQQKIWDLQKRDGQWSKKQQALNDLNKQLQKDISEWQEKLRKEKDIAQQTRLSLKEATIHLENAQAQAKKLRSHNQSLQQKVQKLSGSELVIRELSKQLEDMSKKNLEQTRIINHLKLEKDAADQELRLLKKRQNDQARIASEWEEKAASLERVIEEAKRKENKLKRDIEDGQEEIRRSKIQHKKLEEELQALSSAQIGWQVERRKYLDEISSLQDQLSRKDYDLSKLNKEIDRWRSKAEDKDDLRMGKKSELREEIERLENELIRKEKKLFEEVEQNKLLRSRLELLQRENKKIVEQKNQTYGQKLRYYVQEMGSIKKLLEEYQNENSRLKIDNNELYQQYEMIRTDSQKLQVRYQQTMIREEDIMSDLQSYIEEVNVLKEKLSAAHRQITQIESSFANLRAEADEEKIRSKKLLERLEASERGCENGQNEIRQLRLKLSQFQTNFQINGKIGDRYKALQRKKVQIEEDWKRLKSENDNLKSTFTFTREDLEKAISDCRNQDRKMREEQLRRAQEEFNLAITAKTQRLEQELLDVYNENNRIRTDLQVLHEENGRQKGIISELEMISQRLPSLQTENEIFKSEVQQLRDDLRKKHEKINKAEVTIQAIESENNLKDREINSLKARILQLQTTIERLNEEIKTRRNAQREIQQALTRATNKKGKEVSEQHFLQKQRQIQLIQQYELKIAQYESEIQKAKDKQAKTIEENNLKMKKLEQKMDEMQEALKEKEKAIESHYIAEVQDLQNSLFKLSEELKEKLALIDQLNEAILVLQGDNVDLSKQLQDITYKHQQERSMLENELNKLKSKFKQAQSAYAGNLKVLEEQLARATQIKTNNVSNSRAKTNEAEDRISRRYDQKLRAKDKKIEELKENVYTLQQTILKFKKKETNYEISLSELQKYKLLLADYETAKKKLELDWEAELSKHAQAIRDLKKQILRLREEEERSRLHAEEKILENQSLMVQLKTIKELYQQLQKELQRRKNNLSQQLQEQSSLQYQLRLQQTKINELQQKILDYVKKIKDLELEQRKKAAEIKRNFELIQNLKRTQHAHKSDIAKLNQELGNFKKEYEELSNCCESTKSELRYSKAEIGRLKKAHQDLRISSQAKQDAASELRRINQDLVHRYKDCEETARRYSLLNQRSREELGCSIEELVQRYSLVLEEKDAQANGLIEEIQELKFLNERKYMDYDEMKKMNFELQLKVEEYEALGDQVETLRRICDKLEQEKKNSVFKEQVLRMQIENLALSAPEGIKGRIESILATPMVPSYPNFSFY